MRKCMKQHCELPAITRGKYCEYHRTQRRRTNEGVEERKINPFEENRVRVEERKINTFEEEMSPYREDLSAERKIINEQNNEFEIAMAEDRRKNEQKEYDEILKLSRDTYFKEKKFNLQKEPTDEDCYNIKIRLPSGKHLDKKFIIDVRCQDILDFLDVYFYEENIEIGKYCLMTNYPKREIEPEMKLKDLSLPTKIMLYVSVL